MIDVVAITKPELRRLPLAPGAANPIHDLLDAVGLGGGWAAGPAAIRLMVFPPEWQEPGGYNIYTAREPRYREACSASIHTGFRPPLTDEERGWIDGFTAIGMLHDSATTAEQLRDTPAVGHALEYVREPPVQTAHLLRRIGHAPGRRALVFCAEQLFVVPAGDIVGFRADRMRPAVRQAGAAG